MSKNSNTIRLFQLSNAALLEYTFNGAHADPTASDEYTNKLVSDVKPHIMRLKNGALYIDTENDTVKTDNLVKYISIPCATDTTESDSAVMFRIRNQEYATIENYEQISIEKFGGHAGEDFDDSTDITFDRVRIYFASGYYLSDVEGMFLNICLNGKGGEKVTILSRFISKEMNINNYVLLPNPLYIGNRIYDKYIEIKVPCVRYLISGENALCTRMNVSEQTSVYVESGFVFKDNVIPYNDEEKLRSIDNKAIKELLSTRENVDANWDAVVYTISNYTRCALPLSAYSDAITAEVKINRDKNYIEFGGLFMNELIRWDVVRQFNKKYRLYDVRTDKRTEMAEDLQYDSYSEWVGYHEVYVEFYGKSEDIVTQSDVEKPELLFVQKYNFTENYSPLLPVTNTYLKYKPIVDGIDLTEVGFVKITYRYRLINSIDDVQILREATASMDGNEISNFFDNGLKIDVSRVKNYNVFNRIENVQQTIVADNMGGSKVQFTKVFYNTSDIVLDENGEYIGQNAFTLKLSDSPKNYKLKFRKYDADGDLIMYDMTDYTVVLYSRDENGKDIMIEPTYSSNMNLAFGEVEFNISINNVLKLKKVDAANRFMSILIINNDNTKYSMFDFTYE